MSTQKRALDNTSSGEPSPPKRPCSDPNNQERNGLGGISPSSSSMEDAQREVRKEGEPAIAQLTKYMAERLIPQFEKYCESLMRNALKEMKQQIENEVQKLTEAKEHSPHLGWANAKSTGMNDVRNLRLQIQTKLSGPIFTGKKLVGEKGASISVALINATTGDVVRSGPESSIKLDVVVLEGDFNKEDEDNWAQEEFEKYMVKEREGKRPLLTGDLQVKLKGGVGELGDLTFTDNSSWNKSKRFRIGLKAASGYCGRIREGKTDAFRVLEQRGESQVKHYPPKPDDEVWRLDKIAKGGISCQKLNEAGIYKVGDFLQELYEEPSKLREVLGKHITPRSWDCLIEHARTCTSWKPRVNDGKRKHAAVLNTDRQLTGLIGDLDPGDTIVGNVAFNNWNGNGEFNGKNYSASVQKNSSQVIEGQIGNRVPVQCNLAPQTCAAPVGPEALLANVGSTVEGHNGGTALPFPVQSQNTICGDATEFSVDESVPLVAHQPISANCLNGPFSPGEKGINSCGLQTQSIDIISQFVMRSHDPSGPMDSTVNELVYSSEQPYVPTSSYQRSSTLPGPGANHVMEDSRLNVANDIMDCLRACLPDDDTFFLNSLLDDDDVRHQQRR